jgi:hypothetical protein
MGKSPHSHDFPQGKNQLAFRGTQVAPWISKRFRMPFWRIPIVVCLAFGVFVDGCN